MRSTCDLIFFFTCYHCNPWEDDETTWFVLHIQSMACHSKHLKTNKQIKQQQPPPPTSKKTKTGNKSLRPDLSIVTVKVDLFEQIKKKIVPIV